MGKKKEQEKCGERVKECRKDKNITQGMLAQLVGVATNHISAIECERRALTMGLASKISKVLGVRIEYLMCEDNYKHIDDIPSYIKQNKSLTINGLGFIDMPYQSLKEFCETNGHSESITAISEYYKTNQDKRIIISTYNIEDCIVCSNDELQELLRYLQYTVQGWITQKIKENNFTENEKIKLKKIQQSDIETILKENLIFNGYLSSYFLKNL